MVSGRFEDGIIKRRNRRRMAWVSLIAMFIITLLLFYTISIEKLEVLDNYIEVLFFCLSSVVLGYVGFATYDDLNIMRLHKKGKKKLLKPNEQDGDCEEEEEDVEENAIKAGKED